MSSRMPAIGIDLGTTKSCVGVWRAGKVDIIPNIRGTRTTPTCVAFTKTVRHFGESAVNQAEKDPLNAVFHSKRLIGVNLKHSNDCVSKALERLTSHWQFGVIRERDKHKFAVKYHGETKLFRPEEISGMVLRNLKETAETFLGGPVSDAVISVPASFNNSQRQATIDAGKLAGLNVLRIINEPTATALAYGLDKQITGRNILIFDLGAGKLDVTIVTVPRNNVIEVRSTAGNPRLGGEDFDNRLVDYLVEEVKNTHGKDVRTKPRSLRRLKTAAERAKRNFSTSSEVYIGIDSLIDDIDFYTTLTRDWFNECCSDLFLSTLEPVESALEHAKLEKSQVDDIILVGGSTRILKIRTLLEGFFGKKVNLTINSDEAVACGAAIQAAVLSGDSNLQDVVVNDVTPMSITIIQDRLESFWIEQNVAIPTNIKFKFDFQNKFYYSPTRFEVYEGVNENIKSEAFIADVAFPAPQSEKYDFLKVTVCVDANGILSLRCTATRQKTQTDMDVKIFKDTMSYKSIKLSESLTKLMGDIDRNHLQLVKARVDLESYIFKVRSEAKVSSMTQELKTEISLMCDKTLAWLEQNQQAEAPQFMQVKHNLEDAFMKCIRITKQVEDTRLYELNIARRELESYVSKSEIAASSLAQELQRETHKMCESTRLWLKENPQLEKGDLDNTRKALQAKMSQYKQENKLIQERARHRALGNLQNCVHSVRAACAHEKMSNRTKQALSKKCDEISVWMDVNPQAGKEDYEWQMQELENAYETSKTTARQARKVECCQII